MQATLAMQAATSQCIGFGISGEVLFLFAFFLKLGRRAVRKVNWCRLS